MELYEDSCSKLSFFKIQFNKWKLDVTIFILETTKDMYTRVCSLENTRSRGWISVPRQNINYIYRTVHVSQTNKQNNDTTSHSGKQNYVVCTTKFDKCFFSICGQTLLFSFHLKLTPSEESIARNYDLH